MQGMLILMLLWANLLDFLAPMRGDQHLQCCINLQPDGHDVTG